MLHANQLITSNLQVARPMLPNAPINSAFPHLAKRINTARNPSAMPIHLIQVAGTPTMTQKPASMELIPTALLPYVMRTQLSSIALRNIALPILQAMDASLMLMKSASTRIYALMPRVKITWIMVNTPSAKNARPNQVRLNAGTQLAKPANANMETKLNAMLLFAMVILQQLTWVNIGQIVMFQL